MRLELRPHAPKSRALPTALHPDIRFFCMIPCEERKSKFFVPVDSTVVKSGFTRAFQPENFRRKLLPQWLPRSHLQGNGCVVYHPLNVLFVLCSYNAIYQQTVNPSIVRPQSICIIAQKHTKWKCSFRIFFNSYVGLQYILDRRIKKDEG